MGARTYNFLSQYGNVNAAMSRRLALNPPRLSVAPAPRQARYVVPEGPMPDGGVAAADSSTADEGFNEEETEDVINVDDDDGRESSSTESMPSLE